MLNAHRCQKDVFDSQLRPSHLLRQPATKGIAFPTYCYKDHFAEAGEDFKMRPGTP